MLLLKGFYEQTRSLLIIAVGFQFGLAGVVLAEESLSGREIVAQCENKYPGEDQKSQLSIALTDKSGNERKTIYVRLWKDNKGKDDIYDKMVLFAMYPPDAKGTGFLRWAYVPEKNKPAEQWINLPSLGGIRRVSARNLSDSFLGSDLTYGDISYRSIDADEHKLLRIDKGSKGEEYYVVLSTPKEANPQYSKKISWYTKVANMDECVKVRVDFYDRKDVFLKRQMLKWQKVGDAWVWDKVFVQNVQTFHKSFFEVSKVKINAGIRDEWFEQRRLERGLK
ncbi:MAG TPA: outer membrane lipoprotein-sorting protein [Gammaproteobacteria bacterium]|nr:outer membrane lipoprotein-sorting protein [Gammaproteobacteria bacterium]